MVKIRVLVFWVDTVQSGMFLPTFLVTRKKTLQMFSALIRFIEFRYANSVKVQSFSRTNMLRASCVQQNRQGPKCGTFVATAKHGTAGSRLLIESPSLH